MNTNTMTLEQVEEKISQLLDKPEDWELHYSMTLSKVGVRNKNIRLSISVSTNTDCDEVRIVASDHLKDIRAKMLAQKVRVMVRYLHAVYSAKEDAEFLKAFAFAIANPTP